MDLLKFSESESDRLKLKIYRAVCAGDFKPQEFIRELIAKQPDVVRLKIPLQNNHLFDQIERTAFPYNIHKSMLRMSVSREKPMYADSVNPELVFHPFDNTKEDTLRKLLKDSLHELTETGFTNSIYEALIDNDEMAQTSLEYYVSLAKQGPQAGYFFYLAYFHEECIGFCSFHIHRKHSEGLFYTVAPAFRSKGFAMDLLEYAKRASFLNDADVFSSNTIIQNPRSIYPQMKIGLVPNESYLNVLFFPLLSVAPAHITEMKAVSVIDLHAKIYTWLEERGYPSPGFVQIKSHGESTSFPKRLTVKIFIFKGKKLIVSAIDADYTFWVYFMGGLPA